MQEDKKPYPRKSQDEDMYKNQDEFDNPLKVKKPDEADGNINTSTGIADESIRDQENDEQKKIIDSDD
ncbi:MAG TPA: hypothetical protein VM012_12765 [Flavitalea sp.]|nr:hypothetical protein [Flavitalea sp.]